MNLAAAMLERLESDPDREILAGATELKAIARCGVGLDNVDRQAAEEQGIAIRSTPEAPAEAVQYVLQYLYDEGTILIG